MKRAAYKMMLALVWVVAMLSPAMAEDLKVRLSFTPNGFHSAIFFAEAQGWFKEAGLNVTIEDGTGSAATVNLVGNGNFDIGEAALPVVAQGRASGLPVVAIACFEPIWEAGLLVPEDSGITSPADLKGREILYGAGSFETPFLDTFFAAAGLERGDVTLVNVDGFAKVSAYAQGQGDALITFVPLIEIIVDGPRPSNGILFKDYGLPLNSMGYFATEKTIADKPEALAAFVSVMSRSFHAIRDDGQAEAAVAAIKAARPQLKTDAATLLKQLQALAPYFLSEATTGKPYGWQAPEDWAKTLGAMRDAGLVPGDVPDTDYYTNAFFPQP